VETDAMPLKDRKPAAMLFTRFLKSMDGKRGPRCGKGRTATGIYSAAAIIDSTFASAPTSTREAKYNRFLCVKYEIHGFAKQSAVLE